MENSIIGRSVVIKTRNSQEFGNWGVVKSFDGEDFHIAMNGDNRAQLVFERSEFTVKKFIEAAQ
jgi:hypothetical protein